jgi:hypothetical protein
MDEQALFEWYVTEGLGASPDLLPGDPAGAAARRTLILVSAWATGTAGRTRSDPPRGLKLRHRDAVRLALMNRLGLRGEEADFMIRIAEREYGFAEPPEGEPPR